VTFRIICEYTLTLVVMIKSNVIKTNCMKLTTPTNTLKVKQQTTKNSYATIKKSTDNQSK